MVSLPYCLLVPALFLAGSADAAAQPRVRGAQVAPAARPMYRQADSGWLERDVYRSPADGGMAVQYVDILLGPGRNALVRQMPTGALLDVKAGGAAIAVDQKQTRGAPGVVIPIDQGQALSIDNRGGERAFVARLIRIASPRRP